MRISHPFLFIAATLAVIVAVVVGLGMEYAASFLRVHRPEHADVLLVLGGGTDDSRYWRGVELMKAGYADKMLLDAEASGEKYGKSNAELAGDFIERIHAQNTTVCPVYNDSTFGETEDVARCLAPMKVSSVLIVTSDYHTRRAFSIFKARLPRYHWSIAEAFEPYADGAPQRLPGDNWWRNRRWAKTILDEWEKLIWWELVDRWKSNLVVPS
jgi:uncharacterized SAM-binding protein YcdF (DUF218 family)